MVPSDDAAGRGALDPYWPRWRIEDLHRVLNSGCEVEYLGHCTGNRIERARTTKAVIA